MEREFIRRFARVAIPLLALVLSAGAGLGILLLVRPGAAIRLLAVLAGAVLLTAAGLGWPACCRACSGRKSDSAECPPGQPAGIYR